MGQGIYNGLTLEEMSGPWAVRDVGWHNRDRDTWNVAGGTAVRLDCVRDRDALLAMLLPEKGFYPSKNKGLPGRPIPTE